MHTASIIRAMVATVRISETSVHYNVTTRRYIPEDSKLHTRRRENLKSHKKILTHIVIHTHFLQRETACQTSQATYSS
jgi:hypothetical protein